MKMAPISLVAYSGFCGFSNEADEKLTKLHFQAEKNFKIDGDVIAKRNTFKSCDPTSMNYN